MKEITTIHIGRVPFRIERSAYERLQKYLAAIEKVTHQNHRSEILAEVESRIVELLAERKIERDGTITEVDVVAVKTQLGEPGEFSDDQEQVNPDQSEQATSSKSPLFSRPLLRDQQNGLVAGVCYGLGKYFGIDAVWIRLMVIALTFVNGLGAGLYIIAALIIPNVKSDTDRLAMDGKPANIKNLATLVEQRQALAGIVAKQTGTFLQRFISIISILLNRLIKLALRLGAGMVAATASIFLLIGVALAVAGFAGYDKLITGFPLLAPWTAKLGLLAIWVLVSAVLLIIVLATMNLMNHKPQPARWFTGLASAALVALVLLAGLGAPLIDHANKMNDLYLSAVTTTLPHGIKRVESRGPINLELYQVSEPRYEQARFGGFRQNPYSFKVENDTLYITTTHHGYENYPHSNFMPPNIDTDTIRVYLPKIESVLIDGGSSLHLGGVPNVELITESGQISRIIDQAKIQNMKATIGSGAELYSDGQDFNNLSIAYQDSPNSSVSVGNVDNLIINAPGKDSLCSIMNIEGEPLKAMLNVTNYTAMTINGKDISAAGHKALPIVTQPRSVCLGFINQSVVL